MMCAAEAERHRERRDGPVEQHHRASEVRLRDETTSDERSRSGRAGRRRRAVVRVWRRLSLGGGGSGGEAGTLRTGVEGDGDVARCSRRSVGGGRNRAILCST